VANRLLETSVYPTQDELWNAMDAYIKDTNLEFLKQFKKKSSWRIYYEKHIAQIVSFWQILNLTSGIVTF
jgi:hypothetical protein